VSQGDSAYGLTYAVDFTPVSSCDVSSGRVTV